PVPESTPRARGELPYPRPPAVVPFFDTPTQGERMSELLTRTFLTALISGGLIAGVSLMFTALGETISERAGLLNIGLEGMMLVGAYIGFVGAYYGHSFWIGFAAGIGGGAFA